MTPLPIIPTALTRSHADAAPSTDWPAHLEAALAEIRAGLAGEERSDRLHRAIYATDASIYQITPDAVVFPRDARDVTHTVRVCRAHGIPLTARGAGTGLAGGAVNRGIILDCSRFMTRILSIDPDQRTARVQPGVVLDELNAELLPHGLFFAPDVATSSRATLGGMLANNSCGARSIFYSRTCDHVAALKAVLADGSIASWGEASDLSDPPTGTAAEIERTLRSIHSNLQDEINARFPKIMRRNGGYALDRLRIDPSGRPNVEQLIIGSEGTLAVIAEATLRLILLPKHRALVVAHFADLLDALTAVPTCLAHRPAAVELIDHLIIEAARNHPALARRASPIEGNPRGVLIIELFDDDQSALFNRCTDLANDLRGKNMGYAWPLLTDAAAQAAVWDVRKSGLGLLMSKPGDRQPYDFVEDTAVPPQRLREYIARFMKILAEEGVREASYYAHASVGCLHVKPVLNLRDRADVQRMRRIADRISSLALEFGGTMTGEHGDGLLRSEWLEKMYGPRILSAFRQVKRAFDPTGILNPGKIIDPPTMTENLRWKPVDAASIPTDYGHPPSDHHAATDPESFLDFSPHRGMLALAEMCSGVGQCRQRLVGTMCPSYIATGDEMHTTRARANALRLALSDGNLLQGLDDPALDEVMDLCISCKACKTECPTGTDMAKLKSERLARIYRTRRPPFRSRLIAALPGIAPWASPFAPVLNPLLQSSFIRTILERLAGFDRRIALPPFAAPSLRRLLDHRKTPPPIDRELQSATNTPVVLFLDTWTHYFTPKVGLAAIALLESLGHEVITPPTVCCGRPAISKGLLSEARSLAQTNLERLLPYLDLGYPILAIEPSCWSALRDESPQLVRTADARRLAEHILPIETFLAASLRADSDALRFRPDPTPVLYHAHCHQKALAGTDDAMFLLNTATAGKAVEINSGCCGMAGSFGHEREHYEISRAIGEDRLFPAVRARGAATIVVSGFSCSCQIDHHTDAAPKHLLEILADRLIRE